MYALKSDDDIGAGTRSLHHCHKDFYGGEDLRGYLQNSDIVWCQVRLILAKDWTGNMLFIHNDLKADPSETKCNIQKTVYV